MRRLWSEVDSGFWILKIYIYSKYSFVSKFIFRIYLRILYILFNISKICICLLYFRNAGLPANELNSLDFLRTRISIVSLKVWFCPNNLCKYFAWQTSYPSLRLHGGSHGIQGVHDANCQRQSYTSRSCSSETIHGRCQVQGAGTAGARSIWQASLGQFPPGPEPYREK